jgi:HK97 family phage prohead protease
VLTTRSYSPIDLEVRADGRTVHGIAAPFDTPTTIHEGSGVAFTEVIRRGAFARTISERGPSRVKLMALHDYGAMPLGRATVLREDAAGLYIEARISKTNAGDEAIALIGDGALDGFSVGFTVPNGGDRWNQRTNTRELLDLKLVEVSLTPMAAYPTALVGGLRSNTPVPYDPNSDPEYLLRRLALTSPRRTFR